MTEEQIKNWAREKANALEENQTLGIYDRDEDMRYDEGYNDGQVSGYEEGLIEGYHEGFKDCAKSRLNVTTISDCPIKDDWHYVKDGDLPKGTGLFIIYWKLGFIDNYMAFRGTIDNLLHKDIIAWKEIVLPKEIV